MRLLILGEGGERTELETLARELGITDDVALPGFVENPYAYLSRSAVFVLSSLYEGLSNVIIEALALGTPVVSTDCRSGPREILEGGALGRLVPVRDPEALATAIGRALDQRPAAAPPSACSPIARPTPSTATSDSSSACWRRAARRPQMREAPVRRSENALGSISVPVVVVVERGCRCDVQGLDFLHGHTSAFGTSGGARSRLRRHQHRAHRRPKLVWPKTMSTRVDSRDCLESHDDLHVAVALPKKSRVPI